MTALSAEDVLAALRCGGRNVDPAQVVDLRRLKGGYSREMWSFDLDDGQQRVPLVLCADSPAGVVGAGPQALDRVTEARLLATLHAAGLPVPDVLASGDLGSPLGRSFTVMQRLPGTASVGPLFRDPRYLAHLDRLGRQLAGMLAAIHGADVGDLLGAPPDREGVAAREVQQWAAELRATPAGPVFDAAVNWLEQHPPRPPSRITLVHGDYRTGNILHDCGPSGVPDLLSVLDWEMAHLGDPLEDVAWAQLVCWRLGTDRVGGLAPLDVWERGYGEAAGTTVDRDAVHFWEVLGTVKMACLMRRASQAVDEGEERALLERLLADLEVELAEHLLQPGAARGRSRPDDVWKASAMDGDTATADGGGEVGPGTASFIVRGHRNGSVVSVTWRGGHLEGDPPTLDLIANEAELVEAARTDPFAGSLRLDGDGTGSPLASPLSALRLIERVIDRVADIVVDPVRRG